MKELRIIQVFILITSLIYGMAGCNTKPEMTIGQPMDKNSDVEQPYGTNNEGLQAEHKVVVKDVLNTERYSYLNVVENDSDFWIAIQKRNVQVGGTYYFSEGILKRNFESKEFNRVFDTIYLVSNFAPHPLQSAESFGQRETSERTMDVADPGVITSDETFVTLSELHANPDVYEGKQIKVKGNCIKVNPMIMERNWVHIQDDSGENLTVTTSENIQTGTEVIMEGTISLNKDFGAGYYYKVIMENAKKVKQ